MANIEGQDEQSVTAIDVIAGVYYDIDTGSAIAPYPRRRRRHVERHRHGRQHQGGVWRSPFQAAAGIGYTLTEDLTLTLGYRLTGTLDADFPEKEDGTMKMALGHNVELGIRYSF